MELILSDYVLQTLAMADKMQMYGMLECFSSLCNIFTDFSMIDKPKDPCTNVGSPGLVKLE